MVDFSNRDHIVRWLEGRPREVAVVTAERAALRLAPVLATAFGPRSGGLDKAGREIVLPAFRIMAAPWVVARFQRRNRSKLRAATLAAANAAAFDAAGSADKTVATALDVVAAARAVATATYSYTAGGAAHSAAYAITRFVEKAAVEAASRDAEAIERGTKPATLAGRSIWPNNEPDWSRRDWTRLKLALHSLNQDWEVWTDWYEARRDGRPADEALEIARVMIADDIWRQGPAILNAEIKRLVEDHQEQDIFDSAWKDEGNEFRQQIEAAVPALRRYARSLTRDAETADNITRETLVRALRSEDMFSGGDVRAWLYTVLTNLNRGRLQRAQRGLNRIDKPPEVPPPRRAAVEPIWRNRRLTIPKSPTKTDLSAKKFGAALSSLRKELRDFTTDINGVANVDRRFIEYMHRLVMEIPERRLTQDELFSLGHVEQLFAGYATTVDQEWPDFLAARFRALSLQFERTLRQSPLWREFRRNAARETLSAEQVEAAIPLAQEAASALRSDEAQDFVDPVLPDAMEQLSRAMSLAADQYPGEAITQGNELLAADLIESINNILKPIAEVALSAAADYTKGFGKGFKKAAKKQGSIDGTKAFKWLRRIVIGAGVSGGAAVSTFPALSQLISKYPQAFHWLSHVLHFLNHL